MNEDDVKATIIKDGEYTAVMRGDHWTILSRGMVIGHLEFEDGMWVAKSSAVLGRPAKVVPWAEPGQALRDFLRREGYLTPEWV